MLEILSVNDPAFAEYGAVWTDVGAALTAAIARALEEETPLPTATDYVPEDPAIQNLDTSRVKAFRVPASWSTSTAPFLSTLACARPTTP